MQFGKTYAPQRNSIEVQILNYRRCPAIRFRQCQPELQGVNWSRGLYVFVVDDSRSRRKPYEVTSVKQRAVVTIVNCSFEQ